MSDAASESDHGDKTDRPANEELLLDAVLHPNRSLGKTGFKLVIAMVGGVCLVGGTIFLAIGAWPVSGFFGLEILLLYAAFRLSYRSGRLTEIVRLSHRNLAVRRIEPNGRVRTWDFQPYWLRVELDRRSGHDSRLVLSSHGRRLNIGSFLSPAERADFAAALTAALRHCRCWPAPVC